MAKKTFYCAFTIIVAETELENIITLMPRKVLIMREKLTGNSI